MITDSCITKWSYQIKTVEPAIFLSIPLRFLKNINRYFSAKIFFFKRSTYKGNFICVLQRFSLLFSHFIYTYLLVRQAFNIFNIVSHVEIGDCIPIEYWLFKCRQSQLHSSNKKKITSHFPKEWIVFPHLCHISKILPNFHTCQYHISLIVSYIQKIVIFPYLPISYFHTCVIFPTNSHISILVSRFQKSVIFPYTDIMFPYLRNIITLPIFFSYFHTCVQTVPPYTCRPGKWAPHRSSVLTSF